MSSKENSKQKTNEKQSTGGGKGAGATKADTKAKTETAPALDGEQPKRKQNRRKREYTVEKLVRMIPASSVQDANDAVLGVIEEAAKRESLDWNTVGNAANLASNKVLKEDSADVWIKAATVSDMAAGDKWIETNADDNIPYRVSVVTEPVVFEVEKVEKRVRKL